MSLKALIIAPTYEIACMVARGFEIRRSDFVYVKDIFDVQGRRGNKVYLYVSSRSRLWWDDHQTEAYQYLRKHGECEFIDVREEQLVP